MLIDPRLYEQTTLLPVEATHTALGVMGELLVARLLIGQGYRQLQSHKRGDLTVASPDGEIIDIEVKTARRSSGRWQFCCSKKGHTNHRNADWLILLAVADLGNVFPFVMPSSAVSAQNVAFRTHPQRYTGRLAKYLQSLERLQLKEIL